MSRQRCEFPKTVRRAAWKRSGERCEFIFNDGSRCGCDLTQTKFAYDHIDPDGLTGKPTLENCQVICDPCHKAKTRQDVKNICQAKRREDARLGIRNPSRLQGRGFQKFAPQRSATRGCSKTEIAYKRDR